MTVDCSRCSSDKSYIFSALEPEFLARIETMHVTHHVPAGHVFCEEGDPVRGVHCILEGAVKLVRSGERGDNQVVGLLGPGEVFGLRPLMAGSAFTFRAISLEESAVCAIPKSTFETLLRDSHSFAGAVMTHLARQVQYYQDLLMALTQRSVRRRIADVLLLLNGHRIAGGNWSPFPKVKLKRREIAQMVSTTPETLSRTLAELARCRLIQVDRKEIVILDVAGLQALDQDAGTP
jgi:CRP-like cAMP-binding protein